MSTASICHHFYKITHELITVKSINANAMLNSNGFISHLFHRTYHLSHKSGFCHQTRSDFVVLYTVGGATNVNVKFIITHLIANFDALCHLSWI